MLRDRNKEIALLMLRNLISDISEDRFIVMDADFETVDPRNVDAYSTSSGEQIFRVRVRLDERQLQVNRIVAGARAFAAKRHNCDDTAFQLTRVANINTLTCRCGAKVQVTDQEALT